MLKKISSILVLCTIIVQSFAGICSAEVNSEAETYLSGIISQVDSSNGKIIVSGRVENAVDNQSVTVVAVPGGTDINSLNTENTIFVRQAEIENSSFSIEFGFSKKPCDTIGIYVGGTNVSSPIKTFASPDFEYVLVDSLDVSESDIKATAYLKNFTDVDSKAVMIIAQYDNNNKLLSINTEDKIVPANTETSASYTISQEVLEDNTDYIKAMIWDCTGGIYPLTMPVKKNIVKSFKVLAIGNSFSSDSVEYLHQIATDAGIEDVVIGNLYIGGCSLKLHWENAAGNKVAYDYFKNTTGSFGVKKSSIYNALKEEDWDYIVMQQVSGWSGQSGTYDPYLTNLIDYVNEHKTNPDAKLAWNMTWAYQANSDHQDFPSYDNDQLKMYNAIVNAVRLKVETNSGIDYIIPTGTAVQNMRTSYVGDDLTRDGYHLSIPMGRYVAGLTWFKTLTGYAIDDIDYAPDGINHVGQSAIKEAVNNAYKKPYVVTKSGYSDYVEQFEGYRLLEYTPSLSSYWHSTNSTKMLTGMSNFSATGQYTKEEIPVGSIIIVEPGWRYRPEGWKDKDKLEALRPNSVTTRYVEVTEEWWGDYNYRVFNISKVSDETLTDEKVIKQNFKIYIPE